MPDKSPFGAMSPPNLRGPVNPSHDFLQQVPPEGVTTAATPLDLTTQPPERTPISGYPVIGVMPPQLCREELVLHSYGQMPVEPTPLPKPSHCSPHAVTRGLTPDDPRSPPTPRPEVREAKQVEAPLPLPSSRLRPPGSAKLDQAGLLWVKAQTETSKSLRQHLLHASRIGTIPKRYHDIVCVTDHEGSTHSRGRTSSSNQRSKTS